MDNAKAVRQALARGYCTKENENKTVDATLIEAMAIEVDKEVARLQKENDKLKEEKKRLEERAEVKKINLKISKAYTEFYNTHGIDSQGAEYYIAQAISRYIREK